MNYSNDARTAPNDSKQGPSSPSPGGGEPPYGTYQAYPQVQPQPQTYVGYAVGLAPRPTAGQRFVRAFLVAIFVWLLFSALVRSTVTVVHRGHWRGGLVLDDWDYAIPPGVSLDECVQGGDWTPSNLNSASSSIMVNDYAVNAETLPFKAETSFDVPLSSETLLFHSRGMMLGGVLNLVTSPEQAQDTARVHLVVSYNREELLDLTKACLITRREGENGVGIFSPVWHNGRRPNGYRLNFEMTVILPELSGDSAPLIINGLETDISNSVHRIEDLNGKVVFNSISLRGSNGPIGVKSLTATSANIHTSNGPISGIFNTTGVLSLVTSNSPIVVDVGLDSDKDGSSPIFNAHTSNGKLKADISLTSKSGSGGAFKVDTTTSNSPLEVAFPASPVDSKLIFKAATSNSPAAVSLNPAYEGKFSLQTSLFASTVQRKTDVEDPSGKERTRKVEYRNVTKRVVVGEVHWESDEKKVEGEVDVRTSNSPLVLQV